MAALTLSDRYLPCVSPAMQALAAGVARVAALAVPVLISGETGTGKSTLARQLYEDSPWRVAPLRVLHGATATAAAVEMLAHQAERTVLLEEVGELLPDAQDALLRVLASPPPGLRLIATTTQDLAALVARQAFRADLFYRLDVVHLDIPPLRHRPDDIEFLAQHFVTVGAQRMRRPVHGLTADARVRLRQHAWSGNVRELHNTILDSVLRCSRRWLDTGDLRLRATPTGAESVEALRRVLSRLHTAEPSAFYARLQRLVLEWALAAAGGNQRRAAELLGIGRGAFRVRLQRLGIAAALDAPALEAHSVRRSLAPSPASAD